MTELKPTNEAPTTDENVAVDAVETISKGAATLAQVLADKKAAIAKKRAESPHPGGRAHLKGKKVGVAPRGTRKSMGKR